MTALDAELADLATRLDRLPRPPIVGLFWACSTVLLPAFQAWAAHRGVGTEPLLREALTAARDFASHGREPARPGDLLAALEEATPEGESPDEVSATSAQDCWICADVCIRVMAQPRYRPGLAIEYPLEPVLAAATEELYGVSQVGSGDEEERQIQAVLAHPQVAAALDFCRWAAGYLYDRPSPTEEELGVLVERASVLAP